MALTCPEHGWNPSPDVERAWLGRILAPLNREYPWMSSDCHLTGFDQICDPRSVPRPMVPLIHCQDSVTLMNVLDRQSPDSQVARAWYRIPHTTTRTVHSWLELLDTTRSQWTGKGISRWCDRSDMLLGQGNVTILQLHLDRKYPILVLLPL